MTQTTNLQLEDQATGANNNTWGDVLDENMRIFEKSITDTSLSISTTGGTTTLTSEQNRAPMFIVSGSLVSNATIRVRDSARKFFWVRSDVSGSFTVTVTTVSGTGVVVPLKRFVLLYSDGTNIIFVRAQSLPYIVATGTASALVADIQPAITDPTNGTTILVRSPGINTSTTPTIEVNGLGALTIVRYNNEPLVAGDIAGSNHLLILSYISTGGPFWQLLNPSRNGGQIIFPATDNPSADPNTLDDYEEGTFTPRIDGTTAAGVGTYTSQGGRYTKIGNRVFFTIRLIWTAHTGTGNMTVEGLPFTVNAAGSGKSPVGLDWASLTFAATPSGHINTGTTSILLHNTASTAGHTALAIDAAATLYVSGQYDVA